MAAEILKKHIELWSVAARNTVRFKGHTIAILVPLFVVMAYASVMTFAKDGLERDALSEAASLSGAITSPAQEQEASAVAAGIRRDFEARSGAFQLAWTILLLTVLLLAWSQGSSINLEMGREIGVLKALGWQTLDIIELKMLETVIIGLAGFAGGICSGIILLRAGSGHPVYIEPGSVFLLFVIGIFPLCAATVFSAWLMGTIEPDRAIRSL